MRSASRLGIRLTTVAAGALFALAGGCGDAVSTATLPDDVVDASADVAPPPSPPEAGMADTSVPDAGAPDAPPPPPTYAIGGTVTGLEGAGLVLENGSETLAVATGGASFVFPTKLVAGASFAITIETQPAAPTQQCTVTGGTGTVVADDVVTVAINCTTRSFTVGGEVVGLAGSGLVLVNAGDPSGSADDIDLPVGANGQFAYPPQESGSLYAVSVKTQPSNPMQECVVANGEGTVANANVTNVAVTCTTRTFAVGGQVVGLAGSGLVLTNNGGDDKTLSGPDATFTFDTPIASGAGYVVAVKTQPTAPHQRCVVTNGSGGVTDTPVSSVTITCKDIAYVDVVNGSNGSSGGPADPWKNLSHAIATTRLAPVDIIVAPGTYDAAAGEIFPIRPKSDQNIVGDIANKGAGPTPTLISGSGMASYGGGSAFGDWPHGVFFGVGVTNASLRGIQVQVPGGEGIGFETATVTIEAVTLKGSDDVAFCVANGSNVTVLGSDLQNGIWDIAIVDAATKLTMRGTTLSNATETAIALGYLTPITGSNIDLGTASSPGNNVILGGPGGLGVWLNESASGSVIQAVGNRWKPVQGADANGRYPATFVDGNQTVPYIGGNNYSIRIPSAGSGIQL